MEKTSKDILLTLNICKQVETKNSPFKTIIYILRDKFTFLVERPTTGDTVIANYHNVRDLLNLPETKTDWIKTLNKQFIKIEDKTVFHFLPLFSEPFRRPILTFNIINHNRPQFKTKIVHGKTIVDNEISNNSFKIMEKLTYNYLYQNIKPFQINNFKLEFTSDKVFSPHNICYHEDGITPIEGIKIICTVPMFQLYAILYLCEDKINYSNKLLIMKYGNKFYRFPYGNVYSNDTMCFGYQNSAINKESDSITDVCYSHIITSEFNGDFTPHMKFNNNIPTSLDINLIKEKVSQNDFNISFIDALLYLSTCEKAEDVNVNIFLQSPNVPKEIIDDAERMENCDDKN